MGIGQNHAIKLDHSNFKMAVFAFRIAVTVGNNRARGKINVVKCRLQAIVSSLLMAKPRRAPPSIHDAPQLAYSQVEIPMTFIL